jgi:hypothetical protein
MSCNQTPMIKKIKYRSLVYKTLFDTFIEDYLIFEGIQIFIYKIYKEKFEFLGK